MTLEVTCRHCNQRFDVDRRDMLRLPPATYRTCPSCRNTAVAPCEVVWSERGRFWSVVAAVCPLCGGRHGHGGNDGPEPNLGARVSHCITGDGGTYILVPATNAKDAA